MALIHSFVDDITVKNPHTRAFLRQRTRQWKICESTSDPNRCTNLPEDYQQDFGSDSLQHDVAATKTVSWFENVTRPSVLSQITNKLHERLLNPLPLDMNTKSVETGKNTEWTISQAVLCPTFAGGMNTVGECVFTDRAVQQAILSFFDEVAQDPTHYRNPNFKLHDQAWKPQKEGKKVAFAGTVVDSELLKAAGLSVA